MARSHALDNLQNALKEIILLTPETGELYVESNNRLRSWILDVARSLNPIFLSVNEHDMEYSEEAIPVALKAGYDALGSAGGSFEGFAELRVQQDAVRKLIADAIEAEDLTNYSPLFVASRTAAQAVSYALELVGDHDVFSVCIGAIGVVERAVVANAYIILAKNFDGTVVPTHGQVADAIAESRAEMIPLYQDGLISRIKKNIPGDFEHPAVIAPKI